MAAQLLGLNGKIRAMSRADLEQIVRIETRATPFPWTLGIFADCLRVGYPGWVYETAGEVLGFCLISLNVDECHLLNLCVDPEYQRLGLGRRLLRFALVAASTGPFERMILEVRASNVRALCLYHHEGFRRIGLRRAYYRGLPGQREDAVVLAMGLPYRQTVSMMAPPRT